MSKVSLALGPVLFNWPDAMWRDFYARVADEAPVDTVYVGEVVCSKREPFREQLMVDAIERLQAAGKTVVLTTLALVTLPRERHHIVAIAEDWAGLVEANDVTALAALSGRPHVVGPLVNVFNEATLAQLAAEGARRICLPPEVPLNAIGILAAAGHDMGVETEVFAFGRAPLAISARCYHARAHRLTKDSCRYVCAEDLDGLAVDTLDGQKFLAVNGVQTLSRACINLIGDTQALAAAGVDALRLSPQSCDMVAVARTFRYVLDGRLETPAALETVAGLLDDVPVVNGFLHGLPGAEFRRSTLT